MNLTFILGTRPEAIKLAPLIKEAQKDPNKIRIIDTQQQYNSVSSVLEYFNLKPTKVIPATGNFGLMHRVGYYSNMIGYSIKNSDVIIVQGDTISTLAGALSGFFNKIPVAHIEAGMRSFDLDSPYPEEGTRRMISAISKFHFCPTDKEKDFIEGENPSKETLIEVTGNTVIDALSYILKKYNIKVPSIGSGVLMTLHRRESFDKIEGLIDIANRLVTEGIPVTYIKHTNPKVMNAVNKVLKPNQKLTILEPQPYPNFIKLMAECRLLLTDSGGIQEEAPFIGKNYLVMREETERWKAKDNDRLVGTDPDFIFSKVQNEYYSEGCNKRKDPSLEYGDGFSSRRILNSLYKYIDI